VRQRGHWKVLPVSLVVQFLVLAAGVYTSCAGPSPGAAQEGTLHAICEVSVFVSTQQGFATAPLEESIRSLLRSEGIPTRPLGETRECGALLMVTVRVREYDSVSCQVESSAEALVDSVLVRSKGPARATVWDGGRSLGYSGERDFMNRCWENGVASVQRQVSEFARAYCESNPDVCRRSNPTVR